MFCGKCGTKNDDNAAVCAGCGAQLKPNAAVQPTINAPAPKGNNRMIGIAAVAVAVVVVLVLIFTLFGGRSAKATVEKAMDGILKPDIKAVVELVPDKVIEYQMEESDMTKKEFNEEMEELQEEIEDSYEDMEDYYEDMKLSYEIKDEEDMDEDDLEYLQEFYEEMDVKVKAGKIFEVDLIVEYEDDEMEQTLEVPVIKV